MTISRCKCFIDQPDSVNSTANQSSSCGCAGGPGRLPKSLGDVFSEQFARARKEVSRKGKGGKPETNQYDVSEEEEE